MESFIKVQVQVFLGEQPTMRGLDLNLFHIFLCHATIRVSGHFGIFTSSDMTLCQVSTGRMRKRRGKVKTTPVEMTRNHIYVAVDFFSYLCILG